MTNNHWTFCSLLEVNGVLARVVHTCIALRVYKCYPSKMPRLRVNLYLEEDVYKRAKNLFDRYGFLIDSPNISAFVNETLKALVDNLEPALILAESGDLKGSREVFDKTFSPMVNEMHSGLNEVQTVVKEVEQTVQKQKKLRNKKTSGK